MDLADPANPAIAGSFPIADGGVVHDAQIVTHDEGPYAGREIAFHEGRIYEAEYRAGMRVFDASDPVQPVQVGWIDTFPGDDGEGSGGAWGVYPSFPSGKAIISDKSRGFLMVWPGPPPLTFDVTVDFTFDVVTPMPRERIDPDGDGFVVRMPANAPCDSFVAVAADDASIVLDDDLEADTGWTVGAAGDGATEGIGTRGDPIGTDAQTEVDYTPTPGTDCFFKGQGPVDANIGDNDVDGGATTLISPRLNLTGARKATVSYWRWYHNSYRQVDGDEGNGPNEDVLAVWISDDDGISWVPVETVGPSGPETAGGWFLHAFDAGELIELTDRVRLRFVASDTGNLSIVEAGVDDLRVTIVDCDFHLRPTIGR